MTNKAQHFGGTSARSGGGSHTRMGGMGNPGTASTASTASTTRMESGSESKQRTSGVREGEPATREREAPAAQAQSPMARGVEMLKEKVTEGMEQGKEALSERKESVTETVGEELDAARTAVRRVSTKTGRALQGAGRTIVTTAKDNPVPVALAAVGLTWLTVNLVAKSRATSVKVSKSSAEPTTNGGRRPGAAANRALQRIGHDVLDRGRRWERSAERVVRANPVATGAALLVLGAAIGFALPRTARENGWFGQRRDRLVESAQGMARTALDKIESVAHTVTGSGVHA